MLRGRGSHVHSEEVYSEEVQSVSPTGRSGDLDAVGQTVQRYPRQRRKGYGEIQSKRKNMRKFSRYGEIQSRRKIAKKSEGGKRISRTVTISYLDERLPSGDKRRSSTFSLLRVYSNRIYTNTQHTRSQCILLSTYSLISDLVASSCNTRV